MQPTKSEIQREVEVLRDLRRRSTTPGALTIDPDLPNQPPSTSPTKERNLHDAWPADSSSSSADRSTTEEHPTTAADDPFHLFWVPASVHPEIAPDQFRAFLKEHARSPSADGSGMGVGRSTSLSVASELGRKRSMLSRQYTPQVDDGVENENEQVVPLRRNRTSVYGRTGPELTINDLQRMEELAEEEDTTKLRTMLRRSMSLNVSPSALDKMDDMPEMGDEADAPIIVPPPGLILRRTARTKIRKPGLPGDGGGHRFGASRRVTGRSATSGPGASSSTTAPIMDRSSSDMSSSDHGDPDSSPVPAPTPTPAGTTPTFPPRRRRTTNESMQSRPDSFSDVFDAYASSDDHDDVIYEEPVPLSTKEKDSAPEPVVVESASLPSSLIEAALGPEHHRQPDQPTTPAPVQPDLLSPEQAVDPHQRPASTSPGSSTDNLTPQPSPGGTPHPLPHQSQPQNQPQQLQRPPLPSSASSSSSTSARKEKDKKGLFGKWGSDKGNKKGGKDKEKDKPEKEDKDSGFFGSLFGSSKKSKDDASSSGSLSPGGSATGRETAQALLGASKSSKSYAQALSPMHTGGNPWARYPLHVERAIYRLSHIKLANPRRPLYEQVLISNLMFWYLGVINKATAQANQQQQQQQQAQSQGQGQGQSGAESGQEEKAQHHQQTQPQHDTRGEGTDQGAKEESSPSRNGSSSSSSAGSSSSGGKKENGRKGSLTKAPPAGSGGGGRRGEMVVRGPQYEMQHQVMEQEYRGYGGGGGGPPPRNTSSPGGGNGHGQQWGQSQNQQQNQPYQQQQEQQYFYSSSSGPDMEQGGSHSPTSSHNPQGRGLPPGAMAPMSPTEQSWSSSNNAAPGGMQRTSSSPPPTMQGAPPHSNRSGSPDRRSNKSPPQQYHQQQQPPQQGRPPARSQSATAQPPPQTNGKLRKGASAHAVPYKPPKGQVNGAVGEDGEDVPLAVWQKQQRR